MVKSADSVLVFTWECGWTAHVCTDTEMHGNSTSDEPRESQTCSAFELQQLCRMHV